MAKARMLSFVTVMTILAIVWFAYEYNTPLACGELIDHRLTEMLSAEYRIDTIDTFTNVVSEKYAMEPRNIDVFPYEEATLIAWDMNQVEYLAYLKGSTVRSIWVTRRGLFPKLPNGFEITNCFGDPSHARIELISHEIWLLNYQLWYLDEGILFQGTITVPHDAPFVVTNNEDFNTYVVFRPSSVVEAVEDAYILNSQEQREVWVNYIVPWRGSWSGVEIQTETP